MQRCTKVNTFTNLKWILRSPSLLIRQEDDKNLQNNDIGLVFPFVTSTGYY